MRMCVPCSLVYLIRLLFSAEWEDDSDRWTGADEKGGWIPGFPWRQTTNNLTVESHLPENWTWNLQYTKFAAHSPGNFDVITWCEGSATPINDFDWLMLSSLIHLHSFHNVMSRVKCSIDTLMFSATLLGTGFQQCNILGFRVQRLLFSSSLATFSCSSRADLTHNASHMLLPCCSLAMAVSSGSTILASSTSAIICWKFQFRWDTDILPCLVIW